MFKPNVGGVDRILRLVVGLGLISLVFVGPQTPWGWIGLIPLFTAVFKFCPAYPILGISTCGKCCGSCKPEEEKDSDMTDA